MQNALPVFFIGDRSLEQYILINRKVMAYQCV